MSLCDFHFEGSFGEPSWAAVSADAHRSSEGSGRDYKKNDVITPPAPEVCDGKRYLKLPKTVQHIYKNMPAKYLKI